FPYGIFQQRNVLASWLATGCGVALYLALTARTRSLTLICLLSLYPLSTALVLTQSRVGLLGLFCVIVLAALADRPRWRGRPLSGLLRLIFVASLLCWCVGISNYAMPGETTADFTHSSSNDQRIRILKGAISLIQQRPLTGWGLGSFEATFPQALEDVGVTNIESDTATHPHNELLFVTAEGGIVALFGFLLLSGVWLWPCICRLKMTNNNAHHQCEKWFIALMGLPLVIHMMTEYPLYTSVPHLMLLLLLFRIGMPENVMNQVRIPKTVRLGILPVIVLIMTAGLVILVAGFDAQRELTRAEADMNEGFIPRLPEHSWKYLTQAERLERDQHLLIANKPGFVRDTESMSLFTVWGNKWLAIHNDADVSAAMIFIAHRRGDYLTAEKIRKRAARVFVNDERFTRGGN
ncbi:O-antigen ligase family protein, partial [Escherichia coli]|nr:O-antigen ligase family protein [Escherichia coli]EHE6095486.1 O-antigen ligase family protein [Escherichia coli]